jgi:hypothetical protein
VKEAVTVTEVSYRLKPIDFSDLADVDAKLVEQAVEIIRRRIDENFVRFFARRPEPPRRGFGVIRMDVS